MAEIQTNWAIMKDFLDNTGLYYNLSYLELKSYYFVWISYEDVQLTTKLEKGSVDVEDFVNNYKEKTNLKKTILDDGTKYFGSRGILNNKYYRKFCYQGALSSLTAPNNFFSVTVLDENNNELSLADQSNAVVTVVRFEPNFNYDAIGGEFQLLTENEEEIFVDVIGNPEVPAEFGGNLGIIVDEQYTHCNSILIETMEAMPLKYFEGQHTNVIQIKARHPKGCAYPYQIKISFYYSHA